MNSHRNDGGGFILAFIVLCMFIYMLLCIVSCSTPRGAVSVQKDSVRTVICEKVVYRDTVIHVPVPVETDKAVLEDSDTSRLSTSLAVSDAWIADGRLHHTLSNRTDALVPINLKLPEKARATEHFQLAARTVTVEVERELTAWQKFMQALGLGCFVALCALTLYFIIRIIRKFI